METNRRNAVDLVRGSGCACSDISGATMLACAPVRPVCPCGPARALDPLAACPGCTRLLGALGPSPAPRGPLLTQPTPLAVVGEPPPPTPLK